ncbi:MAG TPA: ABC transporter permease [Candidatus Eremiobacteraceae bacterium]|nr:ABC transporter permease [Candidatus Eremiobacteraceae bacterium]
MVWPRKIWMRLHTLFQSDRAAKQLDDEMQFHLNEQIAENIASGMNPQDARHAAMRLFGNSTSIKEETRETWGWVWWDQFAQDLRFGFRSLRKGPLFTAIGILTLALGIGANTAIFSLLDQVVLRLLPVSHPEQIVIVRETGNHFGNSYGPNTMSWPMFEDLRDHNQVFSGMFCRFPATVNIGLADRSEQISAELVSGQYFSILGVGAALGRTIGPDDDSIPDSSPIAVLSYSFWRSYFDGDAKIVGRTIALNGNTMTVIGVAQPGFDGVELGEPTRVFVPIMMKTEMTPHSDGLKDRRRRLSWVTAYGRLKPGVTQQQAELSLQPLLEGILELEAQQPEFARSATAEDRQVFLRNRIKLMPGSDNGLRDYMRKPLWLLLALTGAVLLLACSNLANLLLARATARERELAVRRAVGAGRARIVRQLLVESLLLSGVGAAAGLALAFLADRVLLHIYLPADAAAEFVISPIPDARVLAFVVGAMLLTSLFFGLLPAIRGSRTEMTMSLKDRSGALSTDGIVLRRVLVGAQVALSLLLLVGAGLFVRTLRNLETLGPGFPTDRLLTFRIDPSLNGYTDEQTKSFYQRLEVNLQTMPGVTSVGFSAMPLLKGYAWQNAIVGKAFEGAPIEQQPVLSEVSPDYFTAVGIPLVAGRTFTTQDEASARYAVINETFAREFFPGRDPIGQLFGLVDDMRTVIPDTQVIGVISDKKYRDLRETPPPQAYFHYVTGTHFRFMNIYLRTHTDPRQIEDALRERMRQFDPRVPIVDLQTMDELIGFSLRTERLVASLSAVFGALATSLSIIGLYGVLAYVVMRRKSEIGIRMALGALKTDVIWLVMRELLILVAAGLLVGIPLTFALSSLVRSQLFGLEPHDPLTLTAAILGLTCVASLAGLIPALKASRIDPLQSLRDE